MTTLQLVFIWAAQTGHPSEAVLLRHALVQGQSDTYIESVTSETTHTIASPGHPTEVRHFGISCVSREERRTMSATEDRTSADMFSRILLLKADVTGADAALYRAMLGSMSKDTEFLWHCTDRYDFTGPRLDYLSGDSEAFTMVGRDLRANPNIVELSAPEDITFPEKPVRKGDSWPMRLMFPPEYAKNLKITATFAGEKDGKYEISLHARDLPLKSNARQTISNPDGSTTDLVTNETGLLSMDGTALIEKSSGRVFSIEEHTVRTTKLDCPRFASLEIKEDTRSSVRLVVVLPK